MKLVHLRYFKHLASVMSYTKAAKDLFIAQPTLSTAIKRMEQELGFTLFNRSEGVASRIELTTQGKIYLEYVTRALETYDEGIRLAEQSVAISENTMRLGTVYSMKGQFWSQAVSTFVLRYEKRPLIHMKQAYSGELARQLKAGKIDVAFAARTKESDGLNMQRVWHQPLVVCVNKAHPLASKHSVTLDDLKGHRLLTYGKDSSVTGGLADLFANHEDEFQLVRGFDDEITLSSFVSTDPNNVSLLVYSFLVKSFDDVVCLPIEGVPKDFHKVYLMSRKEPHPKLVSDFISFMGNYSFPEIIF
ncbi:MAG TPA: LysR family transcriptional regulator [Eggerthellaceae bacterium]|nr:LysR family transcriptional regulator [Eggerthellaceae bacterium]